MRTPAPGLVLLALLAPAAMAEEAKPRFDPKDLEVQIGRLKDPVASFREKAARRIAEWGPRAKAAVPALLPLLEDAESPVRRAAAFALSRMEKEAAPAAERLAAALRDEDSGVRANAALGLEAAGGGSGARAALARALRDADRHVRANAAAALGGLAADDGATLSALGALLRDEDPAVRSNAAWAVGIPRDRARAAVPALARILADDVEVVRAMAARSLGRIGEDDKAAVAALSRALAAEAERAASAAPAGAAKPPRPGEAWPEIAGDGELRARLAEQGGARRCMAWALGRYKVQTKDAKALLLKAAESDPSPVVRSAAKTALDRCDGTVLPAALEEELQEFPEVPGRPWRLAVVGQCPEVVFRFAK